MSMTFYIATAASDEYSLDYDRAEPRENFANVNGCNLLRAIGLEPSYGGIIPANTVPAVLRAANYARNVYGERAGLRRSASTFTGSQGCRVIEMDADDDYAQRALARFATLLHRAATLKRAVYWA